jgi:hypothetical protein
MKTFYEYFKDIENPGAADIILSKLTPEQKKKINEELNKYKTEAGDGNFSPFQDYVLSETMNKAGSRRRRRRPSRKYKKSAKRVFRKKSRSTRRR